MPRLLSVEHCLQEETTGCLAACAQMVLNNLGVALSQRQLNQVLGLTQAGVPAFNIQRLSRFGVNVDYASGSEEILRNAIDRALPPIVFLLTGDLPYWTANIRHAIVVIGYDNADLWLNDPAFQDAPKQVGWGDFMLAWSEFDYRFALISSDLNSQLQR